MDTTTLFSSARGSPNSKANLKLTSLSQSLHPHTLPPQSAFLPSSFVDQMTGSQGRFWDLGQVKRWGLGAEEGNGLCSLWIDLLEGPPDLSRTASKHVFRQELIVLGCLCMGGHMHGHSWVERPGLTDTSGTQSALSCHSVSSKNGKLSVSDPDS